MSCSHRQGRGPTHQGQGGRQRPLSWWCGDWPCVDDRFCRSLYPDMPSPPGHHHVIAVRTRDHCPYSLLAHWVLRPGVLPETVEHTTGRGDGRQHCMTAEYTISHPSVRVGPVSWLIDVLEIFPHTCIVMSRLGFQQTAIMSHSHSFLYFCELGPEGSC